VRQIERRSCHTEQQPTPAKSLSGTLSGKAFLALARQRSLSLFTAEAMNASKSAERTLRHQRRTGRASQAPACTLSPCCRHLAVLYQVPRCLTYHLTADQTGQQPNTGAPASWYSKTPSAAPRQAAAGYDRTARGRMVHRKPQPTLWQPRCRVGWTLGNTRTAIAALNATRSHYATQRNDG